MLQHEQTDPPTASPTVPLPVPNAADARVTPDELNAALKALEDRQNSTVAIGSVVDELRLNATPEQIWDEVQQQRAQQAATQTPPVQTAGPPVIARSRRRASWWLIAVVCVVGWYAVQSVPVHTSATPVTIPGQTITISGDGQVETIPVKGKDVIISGDGDNLTLQGEARSVTVSGDGNMLKGDGPEAINVTGDGNNVHWISEK